MSPTPISRALVVLALLTLSLLAAGSHTAVADPGANPALFSSAAQPGGGPPAEIPPSHRARFVTVNTEVLLGENLAPGRRVSQRDAIRLNLFGDATVNAVRDSATVGASGVVVWSGHVVGKPDRRVNLAVNGDTVVGSIDLPGAAYKVRPAAGRVHVIEEVEADAYPACAGPVPVDAPPAGGFAESALGDAIPGLDLVEDDGSTIDMMVVWTPAARSGQGGTAAMEALINLAVAETNQAYTSSDISPRVRLVHMAEVTYTESGNFSTDLSRLRSKTDGYMDEVHGWRDTYKADQVTLINNSTQYCGIAYLMSTVSSGFESSAFSVVYRGCATGYYSFGHELGHNQGSHHDRANAGSTPAYPYSYGYQAPDESFRTIMAYNCPGGCTRVQRFSNPDVIYNQQPTGVDHETHPATSADNARSIDNTAFTVANFRVSVQETPPAAPTGLAAAAASESSIGLGWTDNADNETGFTIERSPDGTTGWTGIASVAADTIAYTDTGLQASTTYYYRVRAEGSAGPSDWSDTASATTDAAPTLLDQTATGDIPVAGSVSGGVAATWSDDGTAQAITERESGGKKTNRHSYLEHKWTFTVQAGSAVTFFLNAWRTASTDGDAFVFAYSTDGANFTDMVTVTDTTDTGTPLTYVLPASTSGTVTVRVRDTDRTKGHRALDTVTVDHMFIRSQLAGGGDPPAAPTALSASAVSASQINVSWADNSDDEYGFEVERSPDGSSWSLLHTAAADDTTYADTGLAPATSYTYRVRAFNGAGPSTYSNTASATTLEGIALSASGYKLKGKHAVDLTWSGASATTVDVFRDGALITTTANDGEHTDNIGAKGGATYDYEVCNAGTSTCSEIVSVTF